MILNALGGPVIIEKFYSHTVINAETGVVTYPEKCYFYEGFTVDPVPQSLLDEAYQRGYDSGYDSGYEAGIAEAKPYARELEYIESSGTQYINTGFKPNNNSAYDVKFLAKENTTYISVMGAENALKSNSFALWTNHATFANSIVQNKGWSDGSEPVEILFDKGIIRKDGVESWTASGTFQCSYDCTLFAVNRAGALQDRPSSLKIYYCKIYDNGTLIRDFIPVLDYNGVACLFDKVKKKFYYNQGSGSFNYS